MSYFIIEVANTHGGDINYLNKLIDSFSEIPKPAGMKFQPIHPDKLATNDFEGYPIYQQLHFNPNQWSSIIEKASQTKEVWLDIFDEYGVEIYRSNSSRIHGIKLQVSVLFNNHVRQILSKLDLSRKKLIMNIAALSIAEIEQILEQFESTLNPEEILLEVGFQGYPTKIEDSGLSKIQEVKNRFNKKIVFADHVDGKSEHAIWMPVLALVAGTDVIEKHVMLEDMETKYDSYSSVTPAVFSKILEEVSKIGSALSEPFINEREKDYLRKSIMKPILKRDFNKGETLSLERDFDFKRSGKNGMNSIEIENILKNKYILAVSKKEDDTLTFEDFKKANIAVIIACRLKSSRLKKKALLPIGELSSLSYCIKNTCRFKDINAVILATSDLAEDAELESHKYNENVIFHKGDPEDVIHRYLDICRTMKIDVVVRVTGDNPFIDSEICQILLNSHFLNGSDYTSARETALGVNLEILNVSALEKIKSHFNRADYSEYMTWYFRNNPEVFKLNLVDLPKDLVRDYRLTLDYEEDLQLFNKIHNALSAINATFGIRDIFDYLDKHPHIANINKRIGAKYQTDQDLIDTLNRETKIHI